MMDAVVAPYGSWKSPITSDMIISTTVGLGQVAADESGVYWLESRPQEAGRNVLVRQVTGTQAVDVTPAPFNVRTRVHEYGGGSFCVHNGTVCFSNFADQRVYAQKPGSEPQPITPQAAVFYADYIPDARRQRLICVQEDHARSEREAVNSIAALSLTGSRHSQILETGNDFYASPRLSPDGTRLAWLTWNHPNMPWDGCELWQAEISHDGSLGQKNLVAGGVAESIFQPQWSPAGKLYFVSDRTGWWNLYRWENGLVEPLCEMKAEFGLPQWVFALTTYAFRSERQLICVFRRDAGWQLARLDLVSKQLTHMDTPFSEFSSLSVSGDRLFAIAASPTSAAAVVRIDLSTTQTEVLRHSAETKVEAGYLSIPQPIEFPTEQGLTAHALYYPPKSHAYVGPPGELPPLLVISHGGPTGAASTGLNLRIQYWTSRGFGVLDVDYGGSTGHGRAYRERLNGQWGIVDVDDCVNAARYLVEKGKADGKRMVIRGGSAGGYTTLSALAFRNVFSAGASYYGVSDLEALAKDTHKFESRYLDRLVGPYPARRDLYLERSPLHHVDRLSCPLIIFQGLEDKVVPPNQAELMFNAVRAKGLPVAYVPFEGEQHGFRRGENIKRALEAELFFYSRIFGFDTADSIDAVPIENL